MLLAFKLLYFLFCIFIVLSIYRTIKANKKEDFKKAKKHRLYFFIFLALCLIILLIQNIIL